MAEDPNGKMLMDIFTEKFDEKYPERGGITESELKTDLSDLLEIETVENKLDEKEEVYVNQFFPFHSGPENFKKFRQKKNS